MRTIAVHCTDVAPPLQKTWAQIKKNWIASYIMHTFKNLNIVNNVLPLLKFQPGIVSKFFGNCVQCRIFYACKIAAPES